MDLHGDVSPLISKWLVGISQNLKYCSVKVTPLCLLHTVEFLDAGDATFIVHQRIDEQWHSDHSDTS